jgi:hypothetical protein
LNQDIVIELLSQCGIKGRPNHKGDLPLNFCCFHEHNFRSPSLCVNLNKLQYVCYACGAGGHVRKIFYQNGIDVSDLWNDIKTHKDYEDKLESFLKEFEIPPEEVNHADPSELKQWRYLHPYLIERGFSREIIIANKIGFNTQNARVTIPIFFGGKYYGAIQRTVLEECQPRYLYPDNLQKSAVVYSPKAITELDDEFSIWNEGSLDSLKGAQYGYRTHAILGACASNNQIRLFEDDSRTPILMFDNDAAGIRATLHVLQYCSRPDVLVAEYPKGRKDPGELSKEEYDYAIKNAKHRILWLDEIDEIC